MKTLKEIRKFLIPELNWKAENWTQIVDLRKPFFEPRIIFQFSDGEIAAAVETPIIFPMFPLHSQSVKSNLKLVNEVTSNVYGEEKQRRKIISILASRIAKNHVIQRNILP